MKVIKPTRTTLQMHLSADGYMRLSCTDSQHFFPDDTLLALWRDDSLVLLPTRGAAAGGLMLKQRNANGDRSLLISEVFDFDMPSGDFTAVWDDRIGGLRVNLPHDSRVMDAAR
tara:strand:+ start:71814 stop:72155 length:342 start_codon:yes stop_codon:yes gene_type:complete